MVRFEVSVCENNSSQQMIETLTLIASQDEQAAYECFICCILTHGFNGGIYGNDGSILRIEKLKNVFEDSTYLFDKPKLFFIQACQGDQDGRGFMLQKDSPIVQDNLDTQVPRSITTDADFLFFMAATSGLHHNLLFLEVFLIITGKRFTPFYCRSDLISLLTENYNVLYSQKIAFNSIR